MDDATRPAPAPCQRVNVLGVGVSAIHRRLAVDLMLEALRQRRRGYVTVTGVHGLIEAQDDPAFRRILNRAFLCTPDGMPLVWWSKLHGFRTVSRVYGPDLMLDVCEASVREGFRHFFYGGANQVAEELRDKLAARFPGLQVAGVCEPPFRPLNDGEQEALRRQVAAARPDIFWVGLSTPKQEKFMASHLAKLDVTLMIGVGAAFDFHAGRVRQAPVWLRNAGFEWLFRLGQEPRRLWRRNVKNTRFLYLGAGQVLGLKRYPLD
jgi:N-acetylglucosaminyldiphosphoundecaprenol N-acetyl-beta-D-mannosaminyltransferase